MSPPKTDRDRYLNAAGYCSVVGVCAVAWGVTGLFGSDVAAIAVGAIALLAGALVAWRA